MTTTPMTLWQAIEGLAQQIPLSQSKVENLLSTTLSETGEAGNDVFQFFKSQPAKLSDGVVIANVDLRIKRKGPHPGFMVLSLSGSCITLEEVRKYYRELEITGHPHGHSLDEETSYSAFLPWGELSFGFAERNRKCLASIAFDPKKHS